jgi:hypothetical protein
MIIMMIFNISNSYFPILCTDQDVVDVEQHIQNLQRDDENIYY